MLRIVVVCSKEKRKRWEYFNGDMTCECGEAPETTRHMLQFPLLAPPCTLDDTLKFNENARKCFMTRRRRGAVPVIHRVHMDNLPKNENLAPIAGTEGVDTICTVDCENTVTPPPRVGCIVLELRYSSLTLIEKECHDEEVQPYRKDEYKLMTYIIWNLVGQIKYNFYIFTQIHNINICATDVS